MTNFIATEDHSGSRPTVIALHCSGGTGHQWRALGETLGNEFSVLAPDLIGCGSTGPWQGEEEFSLAAEAAPIIRMIDDADAPVHLVGHSYGGCVALRAACERTDRIASLTLYEPVSFHLLPAAGPEGEIAMGEVQSLGGAILREVRNREFAKAAEHFSDYFNGPGTFAMLSEKLRAALTRYMPKAPLDFHAATTERTPLEAYSRFKFPILLMQGERTRTPTRIIAQQLGRAMHSPAERVSGAGHMGPITHADKVMSMIVGHLRRASFKGAIAATAKHGTPVWA